MSEAWGQYQDIANQTAGQLAGADINIHAHEGIDIDVPEGTPVYASQKGKVHRKNIVLAGGSADDYNSSVTLFDEGNRSGWTFKHIKPAEFLKNNELAFPGVTLLGTVAKISDFLLGQGFKTHFHIDRAKVPANVSNDGARDELIDPVSKYTGGYQLIRTNSDPRVEFAELMSPDKGGVGPTIVGLDFRLAADDKLTPDKYRFLTPLKQRSEFGLHEVPRDTAHYFQRTTLIGGDELRVVGRTSTAKAADGTESTAKSENGNIDFVLDAYDTYGSPARLNVGGLSFSITSQDKPDTVKTGIIPFLDYSRAPLTGTSTITFVDGIARGDETAPPHPNETALSYSNTRSVFENDTKHNSKVGGPFFYTISNSPNGAKQASVFNISGKRSKYYWNSDARSGQSWNETIETPARTASKNDNAAFPDGVYDVKVSATNALGKSVDKTFPVVLANWERTVMVRDGSVSSGDVIHIAGGEQYLGGQTMGVYAVLDDGDLLTSGTSLSGAVRPGAVRLGDVTTYARGARRGNLKPTDLDNPLSVGRYFLVVDYNGDGEYTEELDAVAGVAVGEPSDPPPPAQPYASDYDFLVVYNGPNFVDDGFPPPSTLISISWPGPGSDFDDGDVFVMDSLGTPAAGSWLVDGAGGFEFR